MLTPRTRLAILAAIAILAAAILFGAFPPIAQDAAYHDFADRRSIWGIPNFWNVVTNLPFLAVALWGLRAFRSSTAFLYRWERLAYAILLAGVALIAFGSGYYHWHRNSATLLWDRIPMTVAFMSLLAATIGERTTASAGRLLLLPLMLAVFPPRYTGTRGLWAMVGFYVLAKIFEQFDRQIAAVVSTGGHPWKHLAAASAMLCYVNTVAGRVGIRAGRDA
jgi:hypothetical protein